MSTRATSGDVALIPPSPRLLSLFALYLHWYVGRHFHALRLAHAARFPSVTGPLIVCVNHPSWWDPLTCILLSRALLPGANHYAPIDAAALEHYSFFRRLGLFPVEQGTARGAAQFLRGAKAVLASRFSVLWMTPQGAFTDVRMPIIFRGGLGALVQRVPAVTIVPIVIEYTFWDERLPEILVNCGDCIHLTNVTATVAQDRTTHALALAQQELAALAMARDPQRFETVAAGGSGVAGIYGIWKRLGARALGRKYRPEHSSIGRQR